jgi:hypothetical protein
VRLDDKSRIMFLAFELAARIIDQLS